MWALYQLLYIPGLLKTTTLLNCPQQEWVLVECTSPRDSQVHCLLVILPLGHGATEDIRVSLWENGKHYLSGKKYDLTFPKTAKNLLMQKSPFTVRLDKQS